MCDPASMGTVILGSQAASAVAGTASSIFTAMGQRAALRSRARIADINAEAREEAARRSIEAGNYEETRLRFAAGQMKGRQRAAMGANNVDMSQGSALNRIVSTDYMTEVDAKNIRLSALYAAHGHRDAALAHRMGATMDRGQAQGISPLVSGINSLVSGASRVASSWYYLDQQGAFGGNPTGEPTHGTPGHGDDDTGARRPGGWDVVVNSPFTNGWGL